MGKSMRCIKSRKTGYGYKQTSSHPKSTSALPPKADILVAVTDFRLCEGLSDACRGWVSATGSIGRRRTSLRGGNRGGIRLGGAGGSIYGDLTAAGWFPGVAWSAGSRGSGHPRQRRGGFSTTWRWHWWDLLADLGARQGIEQSEAVAGGKGRHGSRFSKW